MHIPGQTTLGKLPGGSWRYRARRTVAEKYDVRAYIGVASGNADKDCRNVDLAGFVKEWLTFSVHCGKEARRDDRKIASPVLAGLAVGIVLGAGVAYLLRGLLYGIHTFDPVSFGGVSVLFLVVALLASAIPSRRAMGIEPLTALRYE
jgi:hypothetical protein